VEKEKSDLSVQLDCYSVAPGARVFAESGTDVSWNAVRDSIKCPSLRLFWVYAALRLWVGAREYARSERKKSPRRLEIYAEADSQQR
jgi:hypothetical protein